jgi:glycosyltransferase involved in cell wall biosynthesis
LNEPKVRVCISYPADPCGSIPGGIDTFIRGEIDNAPDDIEYHVIGITTDPVARPVGQWSDCKLRNKSFRFFPVKAFEVTDRRPLIPVIVQYLFALGSQLSKLNPDVIEVHRIESLLKACGKPVTAVMHTSMQSLYQKQSDILWSRWPSLYFWLEDRLAPRLSSAFCVREDVAQHYRERYPNLADTCHFQPTWADPMQFQPPSAAKRRAERERLALSQLLNDGYDDLELLMVGEGQLRGAIEAFVEKAGIDDKVHLLGLKSTDEVAGLLHSTDLFVLSSAYEGMPMAVIEALASGVPVATTRVGEVALVVKDGSCGRIAASHSEKDLAEAVAWCLDNLTAISGDPCVESASNYSPAVVLQPVYENYRRLAAQ